MIDECGLCRSRTSTAHAREACAPRSTGWARSTAQPATRSTWWFRARQPQRHDMPSGVVRISLPARRIPFTGGYRAALPGPVRSLLEQLRAGRNRGLGSAHPPLAGPVGTPPRRGHRDDLARAARSTGGPTPSAHARPRRRGCGQPAHRGQFRRRRLHHRIRAGGVRPNPRHQRRHRASRRRPRTVSPATTFRADPKPVGRPRADPACPLRAPFGREARASKHRYRCCPS